MASPPRTAAADARRPHISSDFSSVRRVSPPRTDRWATLGPGMALGRAQLSNPRLLRRSSTQPPSRRSLDQSLTRTADIGRKPRALPAISSQPGLPHTPSRVRLRTAINAPPPWSQPNVSVKHERAGSPAVRVTFRRPVTAPAAPLPSPGPRRAFLTEQQKWRFRGGEAQLNSLMHEFPLLSYALASKAAGCRAKHLLMQGHDVSTLRQAGYSAEGLKNEVFPPPPSHAHANGLCLVHNQLSATALSSTFRHSLLDLPPPPPTFHHHSLCPVPPGLQC